MQIVVDGLLTHYEKIGNKAEKLLILPGWMRSVDEWMPDAKLLSEKYDVILLDLPGFGKTQRPEITYSIYDYATFVEHFLDKLEIKQIILLGHSFGGRVGIILAGKTESVKKLILVDAAGIEKRSIVEKLKITIYKVFKIFFPNRSIQKLREKLGSPDYRSAGAMRDIFIKVINEDLTYLLPEIGSPTLLIWGNKDNEVPEWKIKLMKKLIPRSHLRVVWNAYHSPHLEKPVEFMEILNDYLANKRV
jgi:pimeloyl-ACP methyl ester carboxylesterase